MIEERLQNYKTITDVLQSFATIIALIVGGVWTYSLFIRARTDEPKLQVTTSISVFPIVKGKRLVVVDERLQNSGTVLVKLRRGKVMVKQIAPPTLEALTVLNRDKSSVINPDTDADTWHSQIEDQQKWNEGEFEIEPGESDQINTDFVLPCSIDVVAVVAFVSDHVSGGLGWNTMSFVDLKKQPISSCKH